MSVLHNEESTLKYTQEERLRVIRTIAKEEALADPKIASVVLKALDGIDKQVLTVRRLSIDQQGAEADKEIALLLAQAAERREREGNGNPFRVNRPDVALPDATMVELGNHTFTEAELADDVPKTTASKFLAKYREENGIEKE